MVVILVPYFNLGAKGVAFFLAYYCAMMFFCVMLLKELVGSRIRVFTYFKDALGA